MRKLIVSRHPAAIEFIREAMGPEWKDVEVKASVGVDDVRGVEVAGNLPLSLAAVALEVHAVEFASAPPRGQEYSIDDMKAVGACIRSYTVRAL